MTGKQDAAAAEQAELAALQAKAAQRRAELSATAHALADGPALRVYTRQAMQAAARYLVEATWHAARKAVRPDGAGGRRAIAARTQPAGPAGGHLPAAARGLTACAVVAGAVAVALTWRLRRGQPAARPRSRSGR